MLSVLETCHSSFVGGHHNSVRLCTKFCTVDTIGQRSTKNHVILPSLVTLPNRVWDLKEARASYEPNHGNRVI